MKMDIVGRVNNISLPNSKPLLPLFEAIMNSVQSIEEAKEKSGKIVIEIERESTLINDNSDRNRADVIGFNIKDNGIGFDEKNFDAFFTSDTTHKAKHGGRGIGRFMWLAAFERVEVESVFEVNKEQKKRSFAFTQEGDGVKDPHCVDVANTKRETVVRLINFKKKYRDACQKRVETIAVLIVEQFLDIFIRGGCPTIILKDAHEEVLLDRVYEDLVSKTEQKDIDVKGKKFNLLFVRLYSKHINDHEIKFCANDRVVISEKLTGIPNLARRFSDNDSGEFVCAVYVNSNVLDRAVNSERTGFKISEESGELFDEAMSLTDIRDGIQIACKEYLKPFTAPIAKLKRERIGRFVQNEGVMYRPILKYLESQVDSIEPDASDSAIDSALYGGYQSLQMELHKKGQELLQDTQSINDWDKFREQYDEFFEKITEANRADLARYVCHRKAIIEFLKKQLAVQSDGKYAPEECVHDIIFPRGKTSDDLMFHEHNLWLVDERLAFHAFLSSDQQIKKVKHLQNGSKKEPDILVFDKAVAYTDSAMPFTSITIVEFKRPLRKDYSENENPFVQVARYVDDIRAGKALTTDGRPINIPEKLPFYCFIICDITNGLKEWARLFELQVTPDGLGYFGYKRDYCAYFEVISYDKLVVDAEKRNRAFFEKIGLSK